MTKNAARYVLRKKNRTLIIFIIFTIVLSFLYSCLSIMKSNASLERSLYRSSNSSISITRKDNGYFDVESFRDMENVKGVKKIVLQYDCSAKPVNLKAVTGKQRVQREDLPEEFQNIMSLEATSSTKQNSLFTSKAFSIKEGRHIRESDRGKILVHEDFAKKNHLKLNDRIGLNLFDSRNAASDREEKYEIVGIFSGKKQEKYTGLSSDFSENMVFTDYETTQKSSGENAKRTVNRINVFTDSPGKIKSTSDKIKGTDIDWSKYNLEKDTKAFDESIESVRGVKHIIRLATYLIVIGGLTVLSLILVLWLRDRIYEIGILLSIGISKAGIISQFIIELLMISIPAFISSALLGNLILREILKGKNLKASGITLMESYGILIGIIVISLVLASSMILLKKPKEILSKIS